jgi:hypothetical protein
MNKTNNLNIPAYQRKRSLAAKARKSTTRAKTRKPARTTRKRPITSTTQSPREMRICGHCDGFYDQIDVAVVTLTSPIRIGDIIIFEKNEGLFEQEILSMQINRQEVTIAHAGDDIGLKVRIEPKVGTPVYKVI